MAFSSSYIFTRLSYFQHAQAGFELGSKHCVFEDCKAIALTTQPPQLDDLLSVNIVVYTDVAENLLTRSSLDVCSTNAHY